MKARILTLALICILGIGVTRTTMSATARPSEKFRQEHVEIQKHLAHLDEMVGKLGKMPAAEQKKAMNEVVQFLKGHIVPHAEWEENVLYPAVDKRAGNTQNPFTSTMRHDHKIVGRWIKELSDEAAKKSSNAALFARKSDRLLGLISAHFEKEEEVLLSVLDKAMSQDEFDREIMKKAKH